MNEKTNCIKKDFNQIPKEEIFAENAKEANKYFMKNHCVFINSKYFIETGKFNKVLSELGVSYSCNETNGYNKYTTGDYIDFIKDPTNENKFNISINEMKSNLNQIGDYSSDLEIPVDNYNNTSSKIAKSIISIAREAKSNNLKFKRLNDYKYPGNKDVTAVVIGNYECDNLMYGLAFLNATILSKNDLQILDNSYISDYFDLLLFKSDSNFILNNKFTMVLFSYDIDTHKIVNYAVSKYGMFTLYETQNEDSNRVSAKLSFPKIRLYKDQQLEENLYKALMKKLNWNDNKRICHKSNAVIKIRKRKNTINLLMTIEFKLISIKLSDGSCCNIYMPNVLSNINNMIMYADKSEFSILANINDSIYCKFLNKIYESENDKDKISELKTNFKASYNYALDLLKKELKPFSKIEVVSQLID